MLILILPNCMQTITSHSNQPGFHGTSRCVLSTFEVNHVLVMIEHYRLGMMIWMIWQPTMARLMAVPIPVDCIAAFRFSLLDFKASGKNMSTSS